MISRFAKSFTATAKVQFKWRKALQPEYPGIEKFCLKYAKRLEKELWDIYEDKEEIHEMICEIYFSHSLCLKLEKINCWNGTLFYTLNTLRSGGKNY